MNYKQICLEKDDKYVLMAKNCPYTTRNSSFQYVFVYQKSLISISNNNNQV